MYTLISRNPAAAEDPEEAISRTLLRVGPTQGVQAKLKVKPITRATAGFMASLSSRKGRRCSCSSSMVRLPSPSWYRPNSRMMTPLARANHTW